MTDTHQLPDTTLLIASNKADAIKVQSRDGESIGHVHCFMVNKRTGLSTYAILSLGGFLGINKSYYPLPFELLHYDGGQDQYVVTLDRRVLEGGPSWSNHAPIFDQAYADRVAKYYEVPTANLAVMPGASPLPVSPV
ncbi:PRC-barrel domain-containing protein [Sphingobium boeckii]|uniref:PRC-barrel domain-containing protein n=1 Tax=Sphingobium boeckii TaxID=1082345 RepID=A0A7W9AHM8_9SPHN|nr:PRC-barrel domain-containing protein [Sphingobium boeckii]MBB5685868.1 hypothetical protein [Sphingobium boeckii]